MPRIVLTTIGSLGDLHPILAVALGLRARGHAVKIVTTEVYRARIEALGLAFAPLRPLISPENSEQVSAIMNARNAAQHLMCNVIFPALREMYDDLAQAAAPEGGGEGADLIVAGELVYAAPMLSEKLGIPWVMAVMAPMSMFSDFDPPAIPGATWMLPMQRAAPWLNRLLLAAAKRRIRAWTPPLHALRAELGLRQNPEPIIHGKFSPERVLCLFSPLFGPPQRDWPAGARVTGFTFYDGMNESSLALGPALARFLDAGEAPIVFTLGSAAVFDPGEFYAHGAAAAHALGRRAVLLIGKNEPPPGLSDAIVAFAYAPYSKIFPRAAAIVHQGGIGTTSQALRAGRPMLVMPYNFDQFDNAARLVRLGVARTIKRKRYSASRAAGQLRALLENPSYASAAAQVGKALAHENGVRAACDAIEQMLESKQTRSAAPKKARKQGR